MTPTAGRPGPYRLYFYSHDRAEPPHVHVDRDDASAKFWLEPVALARNLGFRAKELSDIERLVTSGRRSFWRHGMSTSVPNAGERVRDVRVGEHTLEVDLVDGRTIIVPLAWYPRLLHATAEQRGRWQVAGAGFGIHWPEVDEDLSTDGLLRGEPAPGRVPAAA